MVVQCYQIAIDVYAILGYAIIRFHMFCPLATNELYTYAWNTYLYLEASFSCCIDKVDFGFIRNNHWTHAWWTMFTQSNKNTSYPKFEFCIANNRRREHPIQSCKNIIMTNIDLLLNCHNNIFKVCYLTWSFTLSQLFIITTGIPPNTTYGCT